jgi:hypothetical protein
MRTIKFSGQDCVELSNNSLSILVTQSVGPRLISLKFRDGENIFAELPDAILDCPGIGDFHLYGGHRLWHAPEEPRRTYLPDDDPVDIQPIENGLILKSELEKETGIQKEIKILLDQDQKTIQVEHDLTNFGIWPVTLAPWAITQVRPGGRAILPQNIELWDQNPTLPNRNLVLWPYTDINSPYIEWGNEAVLIRAEMSEGHLKIGFPNPRGWMAYWLSGTLFVKRAAYYKNAEYYDFGSSSECYCCPEFLEVETLGPKTMLNPGDSVHHHETWELYAEIPWPANLADLVSFIENE